MLQCREVQRFLEKEQSLHGCAHFHIICYFWISCTSIWKVGNDPHGKFTKRFFLFYSCFSVTPNLLGQYNYPTFFNLWTNLLYIPLSYAYIISSVHCFKTLESSQLKSLSKRPFAIMALFDSFTAILLVMSSTYLPGPLLVLLPQAGIPISMICSKIWLKTNYRLCHYIGALIVIAGIAVVLGPLFAPDPDQLAYTCVPMSSDLEDEFCAICQNQSTEKDCTRQNANIHDKNHSFDFIQVYRELEEVTMPICSWSSSSAGLEEGGAARGQTLFWSFMVILAMVPLTLSTLYKEKYTKKNNSEGFSVDAIYLNNWITMFKTIYSVPLSIPAGYASSPVVTFSDLPTNFYQGLLCFLGKGTITTGCHPDVYCASYGPILTILFVFVFFTYSALVILLLNYTSTNVMFLALTLMVPLSNLIFAMPIIPSFLGGQNVLRKSDVIGLFFIMAGLLFYRFGSELCSRMLEFLSCGVIGRKNEEPESFLLQRHGVHKNDQFFYWLLEADDDEKSEENRQSPQPYPRSLPCSLI